MLASLLLLRNRTRRSSMQLIYSLLIIAGIWAIVYIVSKYLRLDERFGWSIGPLFLLMRTKRFNDFLKRVAKKYARLWRVIGNISIFTGFILMFLALGLFLFTLIDFFLPSPVVNTGGGAVGLIIPGVTISFKTFLYLIIPLFLTMIPHEFAHGVVSHADGVELKSTGLAFFAVFFGAFVEPDEEDLMKAPALTKMRTFAVGMFPNVILGLLTIPVLIFSSNILAPFYESPDGVLVFEVVADSPAGSVGWEKGTVMFDINSTHLSNSEVFSSYMGKTSPNDLLVVNTSQGMFNIIVGTNPANDSLGYLGVKTLTYQAPKFAFPGKFFPYYFGQQTMWMLVVSFGSVLFNALPIPVLLDGDKLLTSFLSHYMKNQKIAHIIISFLRFLAILLFFANLILPLVRYGFVPFG